MANVVDLLHVNDFSIMCTLGPEDDLVWKDTRLLSRILVDGELLDETNGRLPVIYEGEKTLAVWELGNYQVPSDLPLTLCISTPADFEIFRFRCQRLNEEWSFELSEFDNMVRNFRARVIIYHPSSRCCLRYLAVLPKGISEQVLHADAWDDSVHLRQRLFAYIYRLPSLLLLNDAADHYRQFRCGEKAHIQLALTNFEEALQNTDVAPDLCQVIETTVPFLYCLEQGYAACPDVPFQVLQTFRPLPGAQLSAHLFLLQVILDVACSPQWLDYFPLAVKSITGLLEILLRPTPLDPPLLSCLRAWVTCALTLAPNAKEVLSLVDLAVEFLPGVFPAPQGLYSSVISRAVIYLQQAVLPRGPSLDVTLRVVESAVQFLSGLKDSRSPISGHELMGAEEFKELLCSWFHIIIKYSGGLDLEPYKDRLLSLIAWQLSNFPSRRDLGLRAAQSRLTHKDSDTLPSIRFIVDVLMPHVRGILDDDDNQFITASSLDLGLDRIGNVPAQYPKGAAEMTRVLLVDEDRVATPVAYQIAAATARTLDLPEAFQLYGRFMGLLEDKGVSLLCANQLQGFPGSSVIIRDAVSSASDTGNHALALQWSDQGRSKIWDWYFHSRMTIDQVHSNEPIMAKKLRQRPPFIDTITAKDFMSIEEFTCDRRQWEPLTVMEAPFVLDRFLRPRTPADIMSIAEALGGPIVYLNPDRYSSQALVVLPGLDDVVCIPLPAINYPGLRNLAVNFTKAPQAYLQEGFSMERKGFMVKPRPATQPHFQLPATSLLAQLWLAIVKPVLDGLGIQHAPTRTADMPRIWWCPSGPLVGLPIHAAGIYTADGQGPVISDYVVSSYFPSASALTYASRPQDPSQKFSLLTIANPQYADFSKLPGTELELEKIKTHTVTQELTRGEATVEAVKKEMENASWVHFACHGVAKPDTMESALILADDAHLSLREISEMSLPHAEFAFLSACQTAKGMAQAPDQSAHLSMGMLACGYRSVVGTMWQISDEHAPFVADRVYAKMLEGGQPDYRRAACALHDAVQALRKERKVSFMTWLPFIHVGV
ncbi:hypothetical protein BDN72DRAFT_895999 [Pluteus cervinus]|uniref:Uncharacterized protein n=1 Tax=Pluteus cervinus TaxID=181527 RepID=A0ACD3AZJ2_9AGAR|nr:hypothetical protein BDN72DRAFT_895999 [Pluteus cervinus]